MDRGATSVELVNEKAWLGRSRQPDECDAVSTASLRQQRYADEESPEAYNRDSAGKLTELSGRDYLPIIC